jgi:hypothetical protein
MKAGPYFVLLLVSVACLVLSAASVAVQQKNQSLQLRLQGQQQASSGGILGPQGQRISGSVLQDMLAAAAGGNVRIKNLLMQHGYNVELATPAAPADPTSVAANTNSSDAATDALPQPESKQAGQAKKK